jgi:hypothetical protein
MRELILAIAMSALPVVAQAETLPVVFGNISDDELGMAHEIDSGMAANRRCAGVEGAKPHCVTLCVKFESRR